MVNLSLIYLKTWWENENPRIGYTATVPYWLERPPLEWEVVGSIPGLDRPKSLKLVVGGFPSWPLRVIGTALRLDNGPDNGPVKFWLKKSRKHRFVDCRH